MSRDPKPRPRRGSAESDDALDPGLVVAAHGRHVMVEAPDGQRLRCHPRGKRLEAVVGDRVRWAHSGDEGVIERVEPRRNLLHREDAWRSKSFAANLDQLLMLVAVEPLFSESQLARALIAARAAAIPAVVGLNKVDLPQADSARQRLAPYADLGAERVDLAIKARPAEALERLRPLLQGRTTLVLGPSGAGKSTLINLLVPDAGAQVGEISVALQSGRHTTTHSTWYWLDTERSGAVIDSPGFQEFGLRQLQPTQLVDCMPDLAAERERCRFHNCTHREEPQCGIRAAVEAGRLSATRWRIYQELFAELSQPRW